MSRGAIFRLALAETRRSRGKLLFCVFSVAVGVGSLTAVRTAILSLEGSIAAQAKTLMGADLLLWSNRSLSAGTGAELRAKLESQGAQASRMTEFYSMLVRPGAAEDASDDENTADNRLVRVRALDSGGFPFYGEIETDPGGEWISLANNEPVLIVDEALFATMNIERGQQVRLGDQSFRVAAGFLKKPGSPAAGFGFAPVVYIHERYLESTGLIQYGSRIRYQELYRLPETLDPEAFKAEHFAQAIDAGVTIQSYHESAARLQRFLFRLSHFLTMVGLITLLLGGLGIGSAMFVFIKDKLDHAAILRSLGARPGQVFRVYLALALVLGIAGSLAGVIPGALLPVVAAQAATAELAGGLLPIELDIQFSGIACVQGMLAGMIATLLFTLYPVYRIREVSPLRVLRRFDESDAASSGAKSDARGNDSTGGIPWTERRISGYPLKDTLVFGGGMLAIFLFVLLLTVTQTNSLLVALAFSCSIAAALILLALAARLIIYATRRVLPGIGNYHLKQGVANLYRPGNQTGAVITAVGIGVLLIASVFILEASIQSEIAIEDRQDLPNLFVVDIQPDQIDGVLGDLKAANAKEITATPMVSARIEAINGENIDTSGVEQNAVQRTWTDRLRTREYFLSYRSETVDSEVVTAGEFWEGPPASQEISVDEEWADRMDVSIGDTITLDIQGLPLDGKITSFRQIEWQAMRPNSILILSPGLIESAPRMFVTSFRIADADARLQFQSRLVRSYPNVSVIDVTEAAANVRLILGKVSGVISFLAAITMLNGVIILGGAIAAGRFARLKEAMLLKVLGASRSDLRKILISEYALLALLGCLCGWILAETINRPILSMFFEAPAVVPYGALLLVILGIVVLNVGVGLFISRDVARTKPLAVLRDPG